MRRLRAFLLVPALAFAVAALAVADVQIPNLPINQLPTPADIIITVHNGITSQSPVSSLNSVLLDLASSQIVTGAKVFTNNVISTIGFQAGTSTYGATGAVVQGTVMPVGGLTDNTTNCSGNVACRVAMTNGVYTWTFGRAWNNVPACTATEESNSRAVSIAPSTASVTVTSSTTSGNSDYIDIFCAGQNG